MRIAALILTSLLATSSNAQELIWSDEFDGTALDTTKWEAMLGNGSYYGLPAGWGNNELQWYTNSTSNVYVSGGHLHIVAREQSMGGADYTSARIRSRNKGDFLYGRMEGRMKLPSGAGLWPAFWMMPTDSVYGGWASSGEIDIMESVNIADSIHGTIHFGNAWPTNASNGGSITPPVDLTDFHVYAIEWDPFQIRWYFDGQLYHTVNSNQWFSANASGDAEAPFDQPFHFILNLAVGGNWPGPPNGSTPFPSELVVDWVRVYVDELQSPYNGDAHELPGSIEAEAYDRGGAGQAYWDADMTNTGGDYRTDQGVDIEVCSEGGYNVGWIRDGEWMEFTVNAAAGEYIVDARVASNADGGAFHFELDGENVSGSIEAPGTGGWQNWQTVTGSFEIPTSGEHVLRFVVDDAGDGFNLNRFDFTFVPPFEGDANGDGVVDFLDLNLILLFWGEPDPRGDLDGSGLVDFTDLNLVLANWGAVDG